MTNLYVYQGIKKAKMYVGHTRMNSETGKLLAIEKSYLELESGRGKCPLAHPEVCLDPWMPQTWVSTLGIFMHKCDSSLTTEDKRVFILQRNNDCFIMEAINNRSLTECELIQQCRKYLNVCLLSDICNAKGESLERQYYKGTALRSSNIQWLFQHEPSPKAWRVWRRALDELRTTSTSNNMRLRGHFRLGKWHTTHQTWEWVRYGSVVHNTYTKVHYKATEN